MSDLDRIKHLAGLTMESARGLLQEFKGIRDKMPQPDPSAGAGFRPGKGFMSSEEYAREMIKGMEGGPTDPDEIERMVDKLTDPSLGAGFVPGKGFAKADPNADPSLGAGFDPETGFAKGPDDPRTLRFGKARAMNDDINRLKHLAGLDEKTGFGRFPGGKPEILDIPVSVPDAKDDGRLETPGYDKIRKLPLTIPDDGRLETPGYDKIRKLPLTIPDDGRLGKSIIDYDEIKRRMDKIKNEPINYLDKYKFKWQGNQD